ncbi:MAG TPA: NAD(P)/FAD-dependent oxidoreductase [Solirubrobacteraceae bacterium]|nr:NAD(P)/FAD-dependent oxidoreductase [Solirubrobacteraceae bacterium]
MRVAIVGAGFSGIAMGIALRREGIEDFSIFERAPDIGGVWLHNTYPGAACDVPSYLYSYSYAQRRDWTRPCSPQAEILDYLHDTAREHGVAEKVRTDTEIARADFDESANRWTLETLAGERITADALILACGQLSRPAWPDIPGRDEFAGPSFHSAEWEDEHDLRGRRVAVIGTGASAIQFVPPLAEQVAQLDVYQRSPPWMLPRRNPGYPGWARALIRRVPGLQALRRKGMLAFMESGIVGQTRIPALSLLLRAWSSAFMRRQVRNPELRRQIWPDYPIGCKRVLFSSAYLPALQRPNVELVSERIARITARGVLMADGREREVDCIVYGTGFKTHQFVAPMEVAGVGARTLEHAWADGAEAHLGLSVAGFPNMFLLYGPNTNLGFGSIIVMIEAQVGYVIDALRTLRRTGADALDLRPEVQAASAAAVQQRLRNSVWMGCQSWYRQESDGKVTNNWPGQMLEYVRATRRLRAEEYRLVYPHGQVVREPGAPVAGGASAAS